MTLKLRSVKRKGSSMANEEMDELIADVPDENEPVEEVVEETPAETTEEQPPAEEEVTEEEVKETESQVEKLFEVDHSGKTVPLDKHTKLRERAQKAEAERDALLEQQGKVDTAPLDELSKLVNETDDGEYVDKDTLKKVVEKLPNTIAQIAAKTTTEALGNVQMQNIAAKARADEVEFKKNNPDYDTIVGFAARHKLLDTNELKEIFSSDNIAETYYAKAKAAVDMERAALGVQTSQPQPNNQQPTGTPAADEQPLDDDAGFEMFMGGGEQVS
jgi:hypothetical protein